MADFPTPPFFEAPALGGTPLEFRDETYPAKTREIWGYRAMLSRGNEFGVKWKLLRPHWQLRSTVHVLFIAKLKDSKSLILVPIDFSLYDFLGCR